MKIFKDDRPATQQELKFAGFILIAVGALFLANVHSFTHISHTLAYIAGCGPIISGICLWTWPTK